MVNDEIYEVHIVTLADGSKLVKHTGKILLLLINRHWGGGGQDAMPPLQVKLLYNDSILLERKHLLIMPLRLLSLPAAFT